MNLGVPGTNGHLPACAMFVSLTVSKNRHRFPEIRMFYFCSIRRAQHPDALAGMG